MKRVVVLTGAGMSAESGISTFRDAGGLWEGHDVMEVASPEGWNRNSKLVLDFYNKRRRQLKEVVPNQAHLALVDLEELYDVQIVTQNVDDLHERAGSQSVLHLHGELRKVRSLGPDNTVYPWSDDLDAHHRCENGYPMRPHIVWFGELVPAMDQASQIIRTADLVMIIGTSLQVYPAAGLLWDAPIGAPVYYIDPHPASTSHFGRRDIHIHPVAATLGVPPIVAELLQKK